LNQRAVTDQRHHTTLVTYFNTKDERQPRSIAAKHKRGQTVVLLDWLNTPVLPHLLGGAEFGKPDTRTGVAPHSDFRRPMRRIPWPDAADIEKPERPGGLIGRRIAEDQVVLERHAFALTLFGRHPYHAFFNL